MAQLLEQKSNLIPHLNHLDLDIEKLVMNDTPTKSQKKLSRKEILLKIILKIKSLLPEEDLQNFYVGGSYALATFGLKNFDDVHDLDFRIDNPSIIAQNIFSRLENIDPSFDSSFVNRRVAGAQFIFDGIAIDIFYMNKIFNKITICELIPGRENKREYIKLATIPDIVDEKKKLKRPKDILSLMQLSSQFITQEEIKEMINNLAKKKV